jgi:20S proteasome alpha/beta subunit
MTIIVGTTTPDGIVLASDSRMTRAIGDSYRILSDSSQKVFDVGGYGVAMAGLAFIADDTIAGLMDQFLAQLNVEDRKSVDTMADALGAFFHTRFAAWFASNDVTYDVEESGYQLLFFVAGYADDGIGHIRQVLIPGPTSLRSRQTQRCQTQYGVVRQT